MTKIIIILIPTKFSLSLQEKNMCLLKLIKRIFSLNQENENIKSSSCHINSNTLPYIEANFNDYNEILSYNLTIPNAFISSYKNLTLEDAVFMKDLHDKYPGFVSFSIYTDGPIERLSIISLKIDDDHIGWISKYNTSYIDDIIDTYRSLNNKKEYRFYGNSDAEKWEFRSENKIECALLGVELKVNIPHYYNETINDMKSTIKSSEDCDYKLVYLRNGCIEECKHCSEGIYEYELLSYLSFRSKTKIEIIEFENELNELEDEFKDKLNIDRVLKSFSSIGAVLDKPYQILTAGTYTKYEMNNENTVTGYLQSKARSVYTYLIEDFLNDRRISFEFNPKCVYLKKGEEYIPFELASTPLDLLKQKQKERTVTKTVKLDT